MGGGAPGGGAGGGGLHEHGGEGVGPRLLVLQGRQLQLEHLGGGEGGSFHNCALHQSML